MLMTHRCHHPVTASHRPVMAEARPGARTHPVGGTND
jgi:hypothetical protein